MKKLRTYNCQYRREKWFIDNDYQVTIRPNHLGKNPKYIVCVRRKGITTEGKPYKYVNGLKIESTYYEVDRLFKNYNEANEYLYELRDELQRNYG